METNKVKAGTNYACPPVHDTENCWCKKGEE